VLNFAFARFQKVDKCGEVAVLESVSSLFRHPQKLGLMPEDNEWKASPTSVALKQSDVHIWRARLDCDSSTRSRYAALLSEDERQRASRFHFERDRDRFIAGRGFLREVLARYVETPPQHLTFRYGAYGKPSLLHRSNVSFNLSHSQDVALFAIAQSFRIGVDVEFVRPEIDHIEIATGYFSRSENDSLRLLEPQDRCQAFFNCWTRKEAYVKALGEGLSAPLERFDVTHAPGIPARLIVDRLDPMMSQRWTLKDLPVANGYVAAAAVEAPAVNWTLFDWLDH
jgi:4'-phosphopantetheinyl transferase